MPESILTRRWRERMAQERLAADAANAAAAEAEAAAAAEVYLDRTRVAARLGITVRRLKTWMAAGRGPFWEKLGDTPQSPVRWRADEVARYLANPQRYELDKTLIMLPHGSGADE